MNIAITNNKQVILFDGVCNLCNSSVHFVIKHDKNAQFLFAPLQSVMGLKIASEFNIDTKTVDSILLYNPVSKKVFSKSTAAIFIAKQLSFPTNLMIVFYVIPAFIRNWVYSFIAKNRYKWFGKKETCMIPTAELRDKFLDMS